MTWSRVVRRVRAGVPSPGDMSGGRGHTGTVATLNRLQLQSEISQRESKRNQNKEDVCGDCRQQPWQRPSQLKRLSDSAWETCFSRNGGFLLTNHQPMMLFSLTLPLTWYCLIAECLTIGYHHNRQHTKGRTLSSYSVVTLDQKHRRRPLLKSLATFVPSDNSSAWPSVNYMSAGLGYIRDNLFLFSEHRNWTDHMSGTHRVQQWVKPV